MRAFIAQLPKVELHVHLIGSAPEETVLELARRHPDSGVPRTADGLRENEYLVAAEVLRLSAADLAGMADRAVRALFLDEGTKEALSGEIAEVLAGQAAA